MTELNLQDDFPEVTREDWRTLAKKGLRGADWETLTSETEDGLERGPLFDKGARPSDISSLPRTNAPLLEGRPWHICAPVEDDDLGWANKQLLDDLLGGASAVRINTNAVTRRADLKRLLEGVHLDFVPIIFAPGCGASQCATTFESLHDTHVTLGLDPIGEFPDIPKEWRAFTADAAAIHEAGGTDVLELAGFAAIVAESFRAHGSDAHDHMSALFALGTDAHLGLAKLRAARRIYARIAGAFGIEFATLPIHAITSLRMMQSEDMWTNMLRTMSAGFGAIAGGADYVTLRPFTETSTDNALGKPTRFGHRIARNQQNLMMEESHLGQVQDVAHGSYFHERLTTDLAQKAWAKFQSIEAMGGIRSYMSNGDMEDDCNAAKQARADRNDPILGVTLHPAEDVPAPEVRS